MNQKPTSTQQRRAQAGPLRRRMPAPCLLDGVGTIDGSARTLDRAAPAPVVVNETKLAIIAVMQELDRPITSIELQVIWAEDKPLEIFEYHLSTLVKVGAAKALFGPDVYFQLVSQGEAPATAD